MTTVCDIRYIKKLLRAADTRTDKLIHNFSQNHCQQASKMHGNSRYVPLRINVAVSMDQYKFTVHIGCLLVAVFVLTYNQVTKEIILIIPLTAFNKNRRA